MTPVIDSHIYVFKGPYEAAGLSSVDERMRGFQVFHALHHQPAWRIRDRAPSDSLRLLAPTASDPLRPADDVDFRADLVHRRFVWTVDGEDVTKHIFPPDLAGLAFEAPSAIAEMDYAGVDIGLNHVDRALAFEADYFADAVRRYPGRLYSMAPVDEPAIHSDPDRVAQDLTHAIRDLGLHAIKFIPEYAYRRGASDWLDGPFRTFWDAAVGLGVPVFLTLGSAPGYHDEREGYRAELGNVMRFQERYPEAIVSLTHGFPWRAFLEGPGLTLPDWLWKPFENPRLNIEVSFPVRLGDLFEYPWREVWPALEAMLRNVGADRLLWGTDMPFQNRFCTYRQSHMWLDRTGLMSPEELALVKGGTAARLLGLSQRRRDPACEGR
jgi:predicted TIM-barrel fold metal-dependent hydrolase